MKQKLLLTKSLRAALLTLGVVLLTFVKVNALTINVHADYPPFVYAWNGETKYLGEWPGQQVTDIITHNGVNYYSVEIAADNVSFILNNNLGGQTGTMTANGDKYLDYDSSTSCTEALPGCAVTQENYFVYFANAVPDSWTGETMYAHIYNDSGNTLTWKSNDEIMTYVGTNGYGNKVYLWNSTLNFTPTKIIFTDGSNETNAAEWTNGGYYNNYNNGANGKKDAILLTVVPSTRTGVLLTSDNFSDANFRAALSEITGVAEGQTLNVSTINTLHIENRGINTLNGINYFSNLEELYAGNNNITYADLQSNTKLRILDLHKNENLLGFGTGTPGSSNPIVRLPSGCLKYLNMSNTRLRNYAEAAFANKVASTLETFIARDVFYTTDEAKLAYNKIPSIATLTKLKYLDVSGCDGTPVTIISTSLANVKSTLEYLDVSNQNMSSSGAAQTISGFTALETLKFANQPSWANTMTITGCTSLKEVDLSGNTHMKAISITGSPLDSVVVTGNSNVPSITINNCGLTDLSAIKGLGTLAALVTLNLDYNNISDVTALETAVAEGHLPKLVDLFLSNNDLRTITLNESVLSRVNLSYNTNLTTVDLSNNEITCAAFSNCSSLKSLNLCNNKIDIIAQNYGGTNYTSVNWGSKYNTLYINSLSQTFDYLNLSGNKFTNVDCTRMPDTKELNMSGNLITNMSFTKFASLEKLDVSNNKFTANVDIKQSPNLEWLNISGNTNIKGFNGATAPIVNIDNCKKLIYLDATGCSTLNSTANLSNVGTSLETLLMKDCTTFDGFGSTTAASLTACKLLDLSNTKLTTTSYTHLPPNVEDLRMNSISTLSTIQITDKASLNDFSANNSNDLTWLGFTGCPSLEKIDVTNDPKLTTLGLVNNGLSENSSIDLQNMLVGVDDGSGVSTTTKLEALDLSQNNYTAIPAIPSMFKYLYLQENAFAQDFTLNGDAISLKGIALSNKSTVAPIKKFTASVAQTTPDQWAIDYSLTTPAIVQTNASAADGSNTVLEAINLAGNNALDSVKVNGFKAITKLASDNDMTTDAGKGIYVKGLSSLKKLDISGNRIVLIGQDGSLSGLSGLEQLDASHNVIRTLTNRTARGKRAACGAGMYEEATCPNIEDLTGLKRLNLSYNHLCDSIHLETNHALEWLDVSHNRFINDRSNAVNEGQLYYLDSQDGVIKPWKETEWKVRRDFYTDDANDTIGLRMLDLYRQTNLRYLNISETYIENTAKDRIHVANRQGPLTLTKETQADHEGHTVGRWGVPRFVLINHCALLDTLICNYNGMKSLGINSAPQASNSSNGGQITGCPNLKYLEAKEMRGQDPAIMQGELRVSARNPLMEHYDVSGSNFDYIGLADGATGEHLRYINVSGNYQSQNTYTDNGNGTWTTTYTDRNGGTHSYTVHGNPYQLNLSALPVLDSLVSVNTPHLQVMSAHNMPEFNYMEITQDPANNDLRELYLHHNATMNDVIGLETLNHLEVYQINDSHFTGTLEMPAAATATLRDLRVSNEALSYAASRNNLTSVALGSFNALERVDVQNNPAIAALDINSSSAATLAHLDFANCHLDNNGFTGRGINQLTALEYLDCSNDNTNAPNGTAGNWLTDLDLTAAKGLTTLKAANNELYKLAVSPSQTMDVLDFHNNHVNGIDLTGVSVTTYNCDNNGRKVKANAKAMAGGKTLYYFQLDANAAGPTKGGNFVGDEQSDMYLHTGSKRMLRADGFDATKASFASTVTHTSSSGAPRLKDAATADDLDPSKIYGTIAVLKPTATSGDSRASYSYDEGNANLNTEFYLDWNASDAIVTAIDDINGNVGEVSLRPGVGGMEVVGPAGQTFGVYDMAGRLVQQVTTDQTGRATIDGLTPGIYVVAGEKAQVR